jgi:hypothetical protein
VTIMQVAIQIKLSLDKAQALKTRVKELADGAKKNRLQLEKLHSKKPSPEGEEAVSFAKELELDMNITNLLRAMVDHGIETLLTSPDATLATLIHTSKATRGRPVRKAGGGA